MQTIQLGYSPCPNDTFIFHAIASGRATLPGVRFTPVIADVEALNQMAVKEELDVTKLSFYAWLKLQDTYRLLQSGAALGYGCGPVVISKRQVTRDDMPSCRVVIPGENTTAHLLFSLWAPGTFEKKIVPYDEIFGKVASGEADCGVIIHENRFTFKQAGFTEIMDLGAWWETETGMPIPLGCIAARTSLGDLPAVDMESLIRRSIDITRKAPSSAMPYIRRYAREIAEDVLLRHINTFVNEFSMDLGERGMAAVNELKKRAGDAGLIP